MLSNRNLTNEPGPLFKRLWYMWINNSSFLSCLRIKCLLTDHFGPIDDDEFFIENSVSLVTSVYSKNGNFLAQNSLQKACPKLAEGLF